MLIGQRLYTERPFLNMSMGLARGYVRLKLEKLRGEGARPERPTNALVPLILRVAQRWADATAPKGRVVRSRRPSRF